MLELIPDRGLKNEPGANNCFLNVILQSFFHLRCFVEAFKSRREHVCKRDGKHHCIFCALKQLFEQHLRADDSSNMPPNAVREALSSLFSEADRFQLNQMDDAAEAFDALLQTLHESEQVPKDKEGNCYPPCFVHQTFGLNVSEQCECHHCGEVSEPLIYWSFVYWVSASLIMKSTERVRFAQLVKHATEVTEKSCDNRVCGKKAPIHRYCLQLPRVFVLGTIWDSDEVCRDQIDAFVCRIEEFVATQELFSAPPGLPPPRGRSLPDSELMGVVGYYGKHYIAFFKSQQNPTSSQWVLFDDSRVRPLAKDWPSVQSYIVEGKIQPFLLFYETGRTPPPFRPPTPKPANLAATTTSSSAQSSAPPTTVPTPISTPPLTQTAAPLAPTALHTHSPSFSASLLSPRFPPPVRVSQGSLAMPPEIPVPAHAVNTLGLRSGPLSRDPPVLPARRVEPLHSTSLYARENREISLRAEPLTSAYGGIERERDKEREGSGSGAEALLGTRAGLVPDNHLADHRGSSPVRVPPLYADRDRFPPPHVLPRVTKPPDTWQPPQFVMQRPPLERPTDMFGVSRYPTGLTSPLPQTRAHRSNSTPRVSVPPGLAASAAQWPPGSLGINARMPPPGLASSAVFTTGMPRPSDVTVPYGVPHYWAYR
eukprot:TRINITY_DN17854_c0_g1_i1.p1 TRINITY_DN17854_c0_g1~~TRINITY_DN17854_c0_g1_i1.p1  ORF type:complete len:652 (-),score=55.57 TRINITY_DN17854_c0_g1_i1:8-1963(-)